MPIHYIAGIFIVAVIILLYNIYKYLRGEVINPIMSLISYLLIITGSIGYILSFLVNDFSLIEVYSYSSTTLDNFYKVSASWTGRGGYIIWWLSLLTVIIIIHRYYLIGGLDEEKSVKNRRLFLLYDLFIIMFVISIFSTDAFITMSPIPKEGLGLNPHLKVIYNLIHPPFTILSYAITIFLGINIISGVRDRFIDYLIHIGWLTLTLANIIGALWAYTTPGWGGYWVWDPVETALLLPWLLMTTYFHGHYLGRVFRDALISLTAFSTAFAAYVTRGGVISPLHGYAGFSPSAYVLLIIGIPFLLYSLRGLSSLRRVGRIISSDLYKTSMNIACLSILGIFTVLFLTLSVQSIFYIVLGIRLSIDASYFSYIVSPFALVFLVFLPACSFRHLSIDLRNYVIYILFPPAITALSLIYLSIIGVFVWSPYSSLYTNILISIFLPFTLISLIITMYFFIDSFRHRNVGDIGIKSIHVGLSIIMIGILLSGPYSYNQEYFKTVVLESNVTTNIGNLKIQYLGCDFGGPVGEISLPGLMGTGEEPYVPEEVYVDLLFRVEGEDIKKLRVIFNFNSFLRGRGSIIWSPLLIDYGLGDYYITINPAGLSDLYLYYGKIINNMLANASSPTEYILYSHILMFLAMGMGLNSTVFLNRSAYWSEDEASLQNGIIISYKYVPFIKFIWLSSFFFIVGEVIVLISRRSIFNEVVR